MPPTIPNPSVSRPLLADATPPVDLIDQALADLRSAHATVAGDVSAKAQTATALTAAQQADAAAAGQLAGDVAARDQKRAALEALIDHTFMGP